MAPVSYQCHNRAPYAPELRCQDGWRDTAAGSREPRMVFIPFAMTRECNYRHTELGRADPGCEGCRWRTDQVYPVSQWPSAGKFREKA